ncbi:dynein axonemal assembly factor 6 isoform X2 [Erythrolamprus reginae]|uniref:dynein axonemal assembly factor 6 isoform X2 n=1 Tax=Erythrolamprus reginae TaxID=121349 RepID=UPI00396C638C
MARLGPRTFAAPPDDAQRRKWQARKRHRCRATRDAAAQSGAMAAGAPFTGDSLLALAELLSSGPADGDADSADEAPGRAGPGTIGTRKSGGASRESAGARAPEDGKAIWSAAEAGEGAAGDAWCDPREQPEYEVVFKQRVRAEDLFLGMSRKDSSTACCEDLVIKIKLPDTKASDITLDIQEKLLDFRSPQNFSLERSVFPGDSFCLCLIQWTPPVGRPVFCLKRPGWKSL